MILSAGRGERMRPLTDILPKPLLEVHNKALILWHIEKLRESGFEEIIINIAHLGEKIISLLGNGTKYGIKISYSDEREEGALESAGGIKKALALLGNDTFMVVNGDVYSDYKFNPYFDLGDDLVHLVLVENPSHNKKGDFSLEGTRVTNGDENKKTFSGIGYYSPKLFENVKYGKSALAPLLREMIQKDKISASLHLGCWHDVGTPQRLEDINRGKRC